ncbi:MAG TPA: hypothetical protein VGM67_17760 [Gemmatimonadaceae bacterium]
MSPPRVLRAGGHEWHVRETRYSPADRRTGTCLIFDAESVIRRVRNFPPNWRTLPDDELYSISLGA